MNNVLFLTAYYPPMLNVAGLRYFELTKYFNKHGWNPYILTIGNENSASQEGNVYRIPLNSPTRSYIPFGNYPAVTDPNLTPSSSPARDNKWLVRLLTPYYLPDGFRFWVKHRLTKHAKRIVREKSIDLVVVGGEPFSMGLAAEDIKRKLGVPYVLDFRDGFSLNPYQLYSPWVKIYIALFERHLIHNCAGLITTTPSTTTAYVEKYHELNNRAITITNGFDSAVFSSLRTSLDPTKFTITYSGVIDEHRDIEPLIKAFIDLKIPKSQFIILGQINRPSTIDLIANQPNIHFLGQRSRAESLQHLFRANLLVLSQGFQTLNTKCQPIAAKTFEYLRTGAPILSLAPPGDNTDIIKQYCRRPYLITDPDMSEIRRSLLDCYRRWENNEISYQPKPDFLERFNREGLAVQMCDFLNKVLAN